jgi:acyl carrier protein
MDERRVLAEVQKIFAKVFDHDDVTPDDDFFSLGGDSLLAEELMTDIETTFSVGLSVSVLLGSPTPRDLTRKIVDWRDAPEAEGCIVSIRPHGEGPPLVCIHGLDGKATFPDVLMAHLTITRPVFGFRALGLAAGEVPAATVAKLAAVYTAELKAAVPSGPYVLIGQCPAAMIAYEMAQQLTAAGDEVPGLILLDPYDAGLGLPWLRVSGAELLAERLRIAEKLKQLFAKRPPGGYQMVLPRHRSTFDSLLLAVGAYPPKPYGGEALIICTESSQSVLLDKRTGFPAILPKLQSAVVGARHKEPFQVQAGATVALVERFLQRVAPMGDAGAARLSSGLPVSEDARTGKQA